MRGMSSPRRVILDCDPGVDDAIALYLAFASRDQLQMLGVTTVAGNVSLPITARNARIIRQLTNRTDVPIYAGCSGPVVRQAVEASHFHGTSGLGSLTTFEPTEKLASGHAVLFLIDSLLREPAGSVSILITGPMTNVAMAMVLEPRIKARIQEIIFMGGARLEGGNITASAEYNIYADPHAAHIVCSSGVRQIALGLDATHQVRASSACVAAIRRLGTSAAASVAQLLEFCNSLPGNRFGGLDGAPLHDPCTVAYALRPDLFAIIPCYLRVEMESGLTLGHTAVEFRADVARPMTSHWVTHCDADGIFALLTESLSRK